MNPSAARLSIRPRVRAVATVSAALVLVAATLWLNRPRSAHPSPTSVHLHGPDLSLLAQAGPAVQIHLAAMLAALALGAVLMSAAKGRALHRTLGWAFVVIMAAGVIASFFVRDLNHGRFSSIHLLSVFTLIVLPLAVMAARRHDLLQHRRRMMMLFYGGLIGAGVFTFVPGRLMWRLFFG
jgi:uncharacterized membrane protein